MIDIMAAHCQQLGEANRVVNRHYGSEGPAQETRASPCQKLFGLDVCAQLAAEQFVKNCDAAA